MASLGLSTTLTLSLPSAPPSDTPAVTPPASLLLVSFYSQSNQTEQLSCNHPNITGGLFTKKFELFFKGNAASAPTHSPRHLYRSPARLWRGLRPRLFFARAIFSPFGRVRKKFIVFLAPPARVRKTFYSPNGTKTIDQIPPFWPTGSYFEGLQFQ